MLSLPSSFHNDLRRQSVCDQRITAGFVEEAAACIQNDDVVLLAILAQIGRRCGVGTCLHLDIPQQLPGLGLVGVEVLVGGGCYEEQTAAGRDRTAIVQRAGVVDSLRIEFGNGAKGVLPCDVLRCWTSIAQSSPQGGA